MRHRRNNRRHHNEVHENTDRWLVSYADFVTLLFAFFVVMYAISSINEGKYRVLSDTMIAAFNTPPKSITPIQPDKPAEPVSIPNTQMGIPKPIKIEPPQNPVDEQQVRLQKIASQVSDSLRPLIDKDLIKVTQNALWVEVEINTSILFSSGSSTLEEDAHDPLRKLAKVLKDLPNQIDVEGHTDNVPIKTPVYPSNWELSASRAASVVHLFSKSGVAPERLSAIGYGEFRPIGDNTRIDGRRQNRRVSILILADKNARHMVSIEGATSTTTSPSQPAPVVTPPASP